MLMHTARWLPDFNIVIGLLSINKTAKKETVPILCILFYNLEMCWNIYKRLIVAPPQPKNKQPIGQKYFAMDLNPTNSTSTHKRSSANTLEAHFAAFPLSKVIYKSFFPWFFSQGMVW